MDDVTETYAMLYGKKEPVGMDTVLHKSNDGLCPRENKNQSTNRDMQQKGGNNTSKTQQPVIITRSGQVSRKLERHIL